MWAILTGILIIIVIVALIIPNQKQQATGKGCSACPSKSNSPLN
jgi:hypothetical protein